MSHPPALRRWPGTVVDWPVWKLAPRLRWYVLAVIAAWAAASLTAAALTRWRAGDVLVCGLLAAFGVITVESGRRLGDQAGGNKDIQGVWQLAAALLLPPVYALAVPAVVFALLQWRVRRSLAHRRVFSAAAVGLANGAAALAFHAAGQGGRLLAGPGHAACWVLAALGCVLVRWAVNNALVITAVRVDDPAVRAGQVLGGQEGLYNDAAEGCVGVLVAAAVTVTPLLLAVALPCGMLLNRSARHAQLVHASRTDAKTGLLTASAWQREAAVQVTRARRTHTPIAVAMVDIDHFKAVNDTYGHLAGDAVLAAVAAALSGGMREYDLAGRFGGEEFTLLMPHADATEALRIAERLRAILACIPVPASTPPGQDPPRITASLGVAVLGPGLTDLTDLLAAADTALYRAKHAGRNTVRLAGQPAQTETTA